MIIKKQKSLNGLASVVLILLLTITLATAAAGCALSCNITCSLTVVNPASNNMPFHASIDGEVGSRAPKIDPGESHTFRFTEKESDEPFFRVLTISRDGFVFGEEWVYFYGNHYQVTVYEDGMGVSFEVKEN